MKIPTTLPVTAEQSRAARFQLGLTQANVIEESSLPGHKLKNFETGRFVSDIPFLESLREYYASKGIDFSEAVITPAPAPAQEAASAPGSTMLMPVSRMCFYVSDQLAHEVVDNILERMDSNDERIAAILQSPVKAGFLRDYTEETEAKQRELFGAMAENYLCFRLLQGRNIVASAPLSVAPATHADLLATFFAASPLACLATQGAVKDASEVVEQEGGGE